VHSAGVLDDDTLLKLNWHRFSTVMAPKIDGSWNLHQLTKNLQLDFFVLFSSLASVFGNAGQGNYSAANSFLDALAHHLRALGLPSLSINWGAWADTGMAAALGSSGEKRMTRLGMSAIAPGPGMETMERLLHNGYTQATVAPIEWRKFLSQIQIAEVPPFFSEIAEAERSSGDLDDTPEESAAASKESKKALTQKDLIAADPAERQKMLQSYLDGQLARLLGLPSSKLKAQEPLINFGFDSLMAVEMKSRIEADLGVVVSVAHLLQGLSMAQVATRIIDLLAEDMPRVMSQGQATAMNGDDSWNIVKL
jgi:acyl carrier protein